VGYSGIRQIQLDTARYVRIQLVTVGYSGIQWICCNMARYRDLPFTRYSFTSRLLRTNQPSLHSSRPPALPTLVQYYSTIIRQYTTPLPTSRLYAIHHTILVIPISCKGQTGIQRDTMDTVRYRRDTGAIQAVLSPKIQSRGGGYLYVYIIGSPCLTPKPQLRVARFNRRQ